MRFFRITWIRWKPSAVLKWFPLVLVLSITGCATQLAFRHLDWLVQDYVEDYVTLTDAQEKQLDHEVHQFQAWLVKDAIPDYLVFLDKLSALNPNELTLEELRALKEEIRTYFYALQQQLSPALTRLAATLTDAQVAELLATIKEQHEARREKNRAMGMQERREKTTDRFKENVEKWLGDLTSAQERIINTWVNRRNMDTQGREAWQGQLEKELQSLLSQRQQPEQFTTALNRLMFETDSLYPEAFKRQQTYNREQNNLYLLQVSRTMTAKQREHFREALSEWKEIAQDIQQQAASKSF